MQDKTNVISHLKSHATYPATKAELVAHCNGLSDFSEEDKKEFSKKLPEGSYSSAEDVVKALGL